MSQRQARTKRQRTIAVVLCAGQGTRMGAVQNKVFLPLAGKPLVLYALATFEQAREIDEIVLVTHRAEVAYCEREIVERFGVRKVTAVVAGGQSRHQSEARALDALRPRIVAGEIAVILIHDGARPFLSNQEVKQLVRGAQTQGGALLATQVADDEVVVGSAAGTIDTVYATGALWRAQTPQAFAAQPLLAAYDRAHADGFEGTDTAATYERAGHQVRVVPGSPHNFKITTPEDLIRAEFIARHHGHNP